MTDVDDNPMREIVKAQQAFLERQYAKILERASEASAIDFLSRPETDEWGTMTLGTWGGYKIQIMPMLFNDRLVMTPEKSSWGYDHGWCYDKGGAAFLAALVWNPQEQGEPSGFKKRATAGERQPGDQACADDRQWMGDALMGLFADDQNTRLESLRSLLDDQSAT